MRFMKLYNNDSRHPLYVATLTSLYPPALCSVLQYAVWEEGQKDFRRARSVWERALETTYRNVSYWLKVGVRGL